MYTATGSIDWIPILFIVLTINSIYFFIAMYRNVNTKKHGAWRKKSIETALTTAEFVPKIQQICLFRNWNLVEISYNYAVIRTYPNFMGWGIFFYVEILTGETNTINVYARGALVKMFFYEPIRNSLVNQFYKA
jgi:hypothetical protein